MKRITEFDAVSYNRKCRHWSV